MHIKLELELYPNFKQILTIVHAWQLPPKPDSQKSRYLLPGPAVFWQSLAVSKFHPTLPSSTQSSVEIPS
jgi:hypothetical protein